MNFSKNSKSKKGFTIVELIVVIAIIGIVTSIIMASISNAKAKGRDSKRIADISVIQLALENYYDQYHNYPSVLSTLGDSSVPLIDPSGNSYQYYPLNAKNDSICSSSCQSYHLGTTLELDNGILDDDVDLNSGVSGDFSGADNSSPFVYDVIPKF